MPPLISSDYLPRRPFDRIFEERIEKEKNVKTAAKAEKSAGNITWRPKEEPVPSTEATATLDLDGFSSEELNQEIRYGKIIVSHEYCSTDIIHSAQP